MDFTVRWVSQSSIKKESLEDYCIKANELNIQGWFVKDLITPSAIGTDSNSRKDKESTKCCVIS